MCFAWLTRLTLHDCFVCHRIVRVKDNFIKMWRGQPFEHHYPTQSEHFSVEKLDQTHLMFDVVLLLTLLLIYVKEDIHTMPWFKLLVSLQHVTPCYVIMNICIALRGYCTFDQFCGCLFIFLKNYNTLVTRCVLHR